MFNKKGICTDCGREDYIVKKLPLSGKKLCSSCNSVRLEEGKAKPKKVMSKRKVTGERQLHIELWAERPHVCECCNGYLGNTPDPHFFSHVLPKSTHSRYRLDKENITFMCRECHHEWEFGNRGQSKFDHVRQLAVALKRRYLEELEGTLNVLKSMTK